jgi:hypothetical protein
MWSFWRLTSQPGSGAVGLLSPSRGPVMVDITFDGRPTGPQLLRDIRRQRPRGRIGESGFDLGASHSRLSTRRLCEDKRAEENGGNEGRRPNHQNCPFGNPLQRKWSAIVPTRNLVLPVKQPVSRSSAPVPQV